MADRSARTSAVREPPAQDLPGDWPAVRRWRVRTRTELLARRSALTRAQRQAAARAVGDILRESVPALRTARVGLYWPLRGEIDLRALVSDGVIADAALPVVVEKNSPLEFWAWGAGDRVQPGFWNIPVPAVRRAVRPQVILAPLVGFDPAGYRLGYGGGYFDRTLAELDPLPLTLGVGYAFARLDSIYPQPHDIPLDAIVTETGLVWLRDRGRPLGEGPPG